MLVTKEKLKRIIQEEYSKLAEGEVVPFQARQQAANKKETFETEKLKKFAIELTKEVASDWAEKYNEFKAFLTQANASVGAKTKLKDRETGVARIGVKSVEDVNQQKSSKKEEMLSNLKAFLISKISKLSGDYKSALQQSLMGKGEGYTYGSSIVTPPMKKETYDTFLKAWDDTRQIVQSRNAKELAIDYYMYFRDIILDSANAKFTKGKRDPFLDKPSEVPKQAKPSLTLVK